MKVFFSQPAQRSLILASVVVLLFASLALQLVRGQDGDGEAEAVAFFNKGQDAHEKGDLKAAIELYEKALKVIPDFPEAELQRGNAFVTLGRLDEAEKAFRHAIELKEDWTLAIAALGDVLVQQGKFAEAETILTKAIELDELNFPAYSALTELRLKIKAKPEVLSELLAKLKGLTSKASPTASIWAARAALENALGDTKAARASIKTALTLEPKSVTALSEGADLALAENDVNQATVYVTTLESTSPNSTRVKVLRARVLYASGNATEALKVLDSIANPTGEATAMRKEIALQSTGDPAALEKQLAGDPLNGGVLLKLCSLLRTKDPVKALDYCRRAADAEPSKVENVIGFGAALIQVKRFEDAIVIFRKLEPIAPENTTIHANLATALFFAKRYAEAKTEYRWLIEYQPNLAAAYYFLGITHDQLGEYLDAMANYQQFLRLADSKVSGVEIEKVNLRLPGLQKQIKDGKGKRNN
jgi:tetratricopeptide (TPR) repeat protein